jgi:hypothetical protein
MRSHKAAFSMPSAGTILPEECKTLEAKNHFRLLRTGMFRQQMTTCWAVSLCFEVSPEPDFTGLGFGRAERSLVSAL